MTSEQFTTVILSADEGHYLTQASEQTPIEERVLATTLALGRHDAPTNWVEITGEQAEVYRAQQAEAQKAREDAEKKENEEKAPTEQTGEQTNN